MIRISPVAYFLRALPGVLRETWYDAKIASFVATTVRLAVIDPMISQSEINDTLAEEVVFEDCGNVEVDIPED